MTRKEVEETVLKLLKEVLASASISKTEPDDPSGISTTYLVDHEQLMRNIDHELEKL